MSQETGGEKLLERIRKIYTSLRALRKELEPVLLDEMSEARAYRDMALACKDPETRWKLVVIALDSILHREIVWSLYRATLSMEMFLRDLETAPPVYEDLQSLLERVEIHKEIEELAKANYDDLAKFAEPGTTLHRLLEMLAREEEKHYALVKSILSKYAGRESG